MIVSRRLAPVILAVLAGIPSAAAQDITYRVTVPEPEHHWLQVEATFPAAPSPLALRMSRSSPGRYALHEFAKNVYDLHAFDAAGRELRVERPDPYGWTVESSGETVRVRYRVFGDRVDGTYLAVDTTHAHMNMPATFAWARGLTDRPIRVTFVAPPHANWKVATQLWPTDDPMTFTAPNLQYFMDSPTEFGPVWEHSFVSSARRGTEPRRFRIALHHEGTEADARRYAEAVEKIVAEEGAVFGEYPPYEPGQYTFLADYLPDASGDGMEHRNSTVMTGRRDLSSERGRDGALGTVAHEFFHSWNVERIRPAALEPFDFERANMSGELWLAEGFTSYYGTLILRRAGLVSLGETLSQLGSTVNAVVNHPGRKVRNAVEMSQMAPFVDAARAVDPTNFEITFLSYYTLGEGLGLALDLSLREATGGRVSLDDYMQAMWRAYGRPGGPAPGLVAHPYTLADARERLAEVSGDAAFAEAFFSKYIEGHDTPDYARLLDRAGLALSRSAAGRAWLGELAVQSDVDGIRLTSLTAPGTPAYQAGLDRDDVIVSLDGRAIRSPDDLANAVRSHKPGDRVPIEFLRRGQPASATVTFGEDPAVVIVPIETGGAELSPAQRRFRDAWLSSRVAR